MRKRLIIGIIMLSSTALWASRTPKVLQLHGGTLNPKDTPAGGLFGIQYGLAVDERVDLTFGIDYFHKSYEKVMDVAEGVTAGGVSYTTKQKELENNTTILPLTLGFTARFPIQPPAFWYLGAAISYQILLNNEKNLVDNVSDKRTYTGFGWVGRLGMEYQLGSKSSLIGELFLNHCKVKRDQKIQEGLPLWEEVNLNGLGFRAGLRVELY